MRHSQYISAPVATVALSCIAFAATLPFWPVALRFEYAPLNYWFVGTSAFAIPLSLAWFAFTARTKLKIACAAIATLIAFPLTPIGLIALYEGSTMKNGVDNSFLPLAQVERAVGSYRLYQTDCGATCAFGLELRREFSLLGVLRVVAPIWSAYRENAATLRVSRTDQVEVVRGETVLYSHRD